MKPIDFFKLQSKNLFKDYKTQRPAIEADPSYFGYDPKFFDINGLFLDYGIDEEKFSLMNAQHLIAKLVGFGKWTDLVNASANELKLAKLLFDHQHKVSAEVWKMYLMQQERDNNVIFEDETRLEIFTMVFANVDGHETMFRDYRLAKDEKPSDENQIVKPPKKKKKTAVQITALPLVGTNRKKFIETANLVFEHVIERIEPQRPQLVREMWNAEKYIDELLLRPDMLPIDRDYALSLIDAFLVHHVIDLAAKADQ